MMRTNGEARPGKRRRGDSNSGGESFWEIKMVVIQWLRALWKLK